MGLILKETKYFSSKMVYLRNQTKFRRLFCEYSRPLYLWVPHLQTQQTTDQKYLEKICDVVANEQPDFFLAIIL